MSQCLLLACVVRRFRGWYQPDAQWLLSHEAAEVTGRFPVPQLGR